MARTEKIIVCCGTGCIANGSQLVADALEKEIKKQKKKVKIEAHVERSGCSGECERGPIVRLLPRDTVYYKVKPSDAKEIIDSLEGEPVKRLLHREGKEFFEHMHENPFHAKQYKLVLANMGIIDPESLEAYIEVGGYKGLKNALKMTPEKIIKEVEISGLRGKGGAGFPTARK